MNTAVSPTQFNQAEVLIVGAGPAGLQAAVGLASEGRSVILLECRSVAGGQAGTTSAIENLLPFPDGLSGADLAAASCIQCQKFGVQIEYNCEVTGILPTCDSYILDTSRGYFHGRVVVLAMGLANKPLDVPGADLPGVHLGMNMNAFARAQADGTEALDEVEGKRVAIIGGGNSAGQAAWHYLQHGAHVTLVVRRDVRKTMSSYLVNRIALDKEMGAEVIEGAVRAFEQQGSDLDINLTNGYTINAHCVHVFIGLVPSSGWMKGFIQLDSEGYVITDPAYRTNRPGVYAIGDVTHDAVRRVGSAVGDGNRVIPQIHKHLDRAFAACHLPT